VPGTNSSVPSTPPSTGGTTGGPPSTGGTSGGTASTSLAPFSPEFLASLPGPVQVINNLVSTVQLAALNAAAPPPVFNAVEGGIRLPPQQQPPGPTGPLQGQQQQLPSGFDRRVIDIPPPTETRFVNDEVVLQIAGNVTVERLQAAVGRLGLTLLAS